MKSTLSRAIALAFACLPFAALADTVTVVTSFPKEITTAYKKAYEATYPADKVEILNKNTAAGIAYVREQAAGSRPEVFWASAPDAFEVLSSSKLLAKIDNWPALLPTAVDAVIDACDQVRAKAVLAAWALREHVPLVCVGAAGGKQRAQCVEVDDLARTTHDPLLAALRQRLRREHGARRTGPIGLQCVFSRENVRRPAAVCAAEQTSEDLSCHGYGSSVTVTATFGLVAAGEALQQVLARADTQKRAGIPL